MENPTIKLISDFFTQMGVMHGKTQAQIDYDIEIAKFAVGGIGKVLSDARNMHDASAERAIVNSLIMVAQKLTEELMLDMMNELAASITGQKHQKKKSKIATPPSNAREFWTFREDGKPLNLSLFKGKEVVFIKRSGMLLKGRVVLKSDEFVIDYETLHTNTNVCYQYDIKAICLREDFEKFNFKMDQYYGNAQ